MLKIWIEKSTIERSYIHSTLISGVKFCILFQVIGLGECRNRLRILKYDLTRLPATQIPPHKNKPAPAQREYTFKLDF